MTAALNPYLHNPELQGEAFFFEGTRPEAILLLHGFTATSFEVRRLGETLHEAGFTTAGPLLPGHGTRPADLNRVHWQQWIETAEAGYQALARDHQRVFVGGESNGGLIALYLAALHPEIAGVLAYAPALILPLTAWQRLALRMIAPFVAALPKPDLDDDQSWQGYKVNPPKGILQLMRLQTETRQRLPDVHQPVLIVQGQKDQTIDPRSAEVIFESIASPVKTLRWMENSGHCVLLDKEHSLVLRYTLDFLAGLTLD
jgi:carboxylesterase